MPNSNSNFFIINRRMELQGLVTGAKAGRPCHDCGEKFGLPAMRFVHRQGEKKLFTIPQGIHKAITPASMLEELEKCDLVCANCWYLRPKASKPEATADDSQPEEAVAKPSASTLDADKHIAEYLRSGGRL